MEKLKVLSLCDGISCGLEALSRVYGRDNIEYHAVEIDSGKRSISDFNQSGIIRPFNDVLIMAEAKELDTYDLILAGPTCTSFSSQGKREEWNGESKIILDCIKIVERLKLSNPNLKILFENVASMTNQVRDEISKVIGLPYFLGRSELHSAQDRNRYYWFNWEMPDFFPDNGKHTKTVLDDDGLVMFSFSKSNRNKKGDPKIVEGRLKEKPRSNTLTTGLGCNGQSTMNKVICKNMSIRNLSVEECARLQGIGNYVFEFIATDKEAYEAIGDAWQVDTVEWILRYAYGR